MRLPILVVVTLGAVGPQPPALDAPITAVTVYSDRARVTRTATVELKGPQSLAFPLLSELVPTESIRVEASGAVVQRVTLEHVDPGSFPVDQGQKLLDAIDALDLQIHQLSLERDAYAAQIALVRRAVPAPGTSDPLKPSPKLDPSGWGKTVAFADALLGTLQSSVRDDQEKLRKLGLQREKLAREAAILGATQRAGGTRVTVALAGTGQAQLTLTYSIPNARWYPSYDIALDPGSSKVSLGFAGLVSQETGEDWTSAAITLSTAIPAQSLVYPTLATWELGEKERFVPAPTPVNEPPQPLPPVPAPLAFESEAERVRQELMGRVQGGERFPRRLTGSQPDADEAKAMGGEGLMAQTETPVARPAEAPPPPPPAAVAPAPMSEPMEERAESPARSASVADSLLGNAPSPKPAPGYGGQGAAEDQKTVLAFAGVGLSPPSGWSAPSYAANLPASLASGYDLSWTSARRETVASGKGPRRIPLFSEKWPVKVERRLFAGLAPEAYLVAELANPSSQVLPGGPATLFVGADPAGTAQLDLVAPGETFTLPLGLDRAVKPVRNLKLVENEQGIIGKDRVSHYVVTIEVANPYRSPISIRIFDQWPVSDQEAVKISLDQTQPYAIQDPRKGSLEWRLEVPASGKTTVTYSYTIRRPKDFQLHQR